MSSIVQKSLTSLESLEALAEQIKSEGAVGQANVDNIKELHQGLESFKEGKVELRDYTNGQEAQIKVVWNKEAREFEVKGDSVGAAMQQATSSQNASLVRAAGVGMGSVILGKWDFPDSNSSKPAFLGSSSDRPSPTLLDRLNALELADRTARRADSYPLEQENRVCSRLFATAKGKHEVSLDLAHSNKIDNIADAHFQKGQAAVSSGPMEVSSFDGFTLVAKKKSKAPSSKVRGVSRAQNYSDTTLRDTPILLYGFSHQRSEMKENLIKKFNFQKLQTMNEYNACIGIGLSLGFKGYCNFFEQVNNNQFNIDVSQHSRLTEHEVSQWVNCLQGHAAEFDFSGRLESHEQRRNFLLKNGADHSYVSPMLVGPVFSRLFREKKWDDLVAKGLKPVFNLLNQAGKELQGDKILEAYNKLDNFQKKLLNGMVTYAFLRKTSKLGMTFAREQNMPVLFAWKVPNTPDDLAVLHGILETKPYKYEAVAAREVPNPDRINRITLEAITLSEMRELGRLKQKMMAPDYLLIVNIKENEGNQKAFDFSSSKAAVV